MYRKQYIKIVISLPLQDLYILLTTSLETHQIALGGHFEVYLD